MTKQKKIREGMEQEVFLILMLSENSKQKAKEQAKWLVEKWFRKLHSQDVVIRVNVPQITGDSTKMCCYEELIEEEKCSGS